jgi:hypothetical protein
MSSPAVSDTHSTDFRELLRVSARFWEPRRILYNLLLFLVCVIWVTVSWPHFRPAMRLLNLFRLAVLALMANICYSAAYVVDIPLLSSSSRESWLPYRKVLWLGGTLFAILLENYWIADEIYPEVQ